MPREKPPTRLSAAAPSPVRSTTSWTRDFAMPWVAASAERCARAVRRGWTAFASSSTPTSASGARCWAYGLPLTRVWPRVADSSPTTRRIVVDLPAPLGPRNPVTLPGRTVKLTSSTAVLRP